MAEKKKELTSKQLAFAKCVAKSPDNKSLADCYREVYDCSPSASSQSIRTSASRLMKNTYVADTVTRIRAKLEDGLLASSLSSRTKILKVLEDTIDGKLSKDPDEMDSVRLKAVELLGRNLQMWGSDTTVNVVERDSESLREELTEKLGKVLGVVRKEESETQPEPVDQTKH